MNLKQLINILFKSSVQVRTKLTGFARFVKPAPGTIGLQLYNILKVYVLFIQDLNCNHQHSSYTSKCVNVVQRKRPRDRLISYVRALNFVGSQVLYQVCQSNFI